MGTRDRILDAAVAVMEERGLARATTKEIARAAGCSEPLLYRYFPDKQALFMDVLAERLPSLAGWEALVGERSVEANLVAITQALLAFYRRSFPIAASIFGDAELLAAHRASLAARGGTPQAPAVAVQRYLDGEAVRGRLRPGADTEALARVLTGAALLEGFLAAYESRDEARPEAMARRIVAVLVPAAVLGESTPG